MTYTEKNERVRNIAKIVTIIITVFCAVSLVFDICKYNINAPRFGRAMAEDRDLPLTHESFIRSRIYAHSWKFGDSFKKELKDTPPHSGVVRSVGASSYEDLRDYLSAEPDSPFYKGWKYGYQYPSAAWKSDSWYFQRHSLMKPRHMQQFNLGKREGYSFRMTSGARAKSAVRRERAKFSEEGQ